VGHFVAYAPAWMGGGPPRPVESSRADPVVVGTTGLIWTLFVHSVQSRDGVEMELAKNYLLGRGPYAFSRHPMYVAELTLVFGWAVCYGSVAVLIAFLTACAGFNFVAVPLEERALEVRFGESYRQYKSTIPRWLGKTRG
jgi:protein-S-isoprenylcysteine O-methyltransferase Ste14